MASRACGPPASAASSSRKPVVVDLLKERDHLRMRADRVRDVQERQPHLRRDVVRDGLRERVGRVLLPQPRLEVLVEPARGVHRPHEHLVAARIEEDPLELLDVVQDEVEQRRSGLRADGAREGGVRRLAALDQLGDDGPVGRERRRRVAGRRARGPRPGAPGGGRRGRRWSAARPRSADRPCRWRRGGRRGWPGRPGARATSTNSLPPASYIRGIAVSWNTESPSGFMGSVIIC